MAGSESDVAGVPCDQGESRKEKSDLDVHPMDGARDTLGKWRKGHSGNPKGRPKGVSLTKLLLDALQADDGILARELVANAIRQALADGSAGFRFFQEILQRCDGRVPMEVKSEDPSDFAREVFTALAAMERTTGGEEPPEDGS